MNERILTIDPLQFTERTYRHHVSSENLVSFRVQLNETDLFISASQNLSEEAFRSVYLHRHALEEYIQLRPEFLASFIPLDQDPFAPQIVRDMIDASRKAGVGPMAAVAGAIAQYVGNDLLSLSKEVIVENGGDIFMKSFSERRIGLFAGESSLSEKITLRIHPQQTPLGVCTSSATIGHSISLGRSDAVCVLSQSAILADASATFVGNTVRREEDIRHALDLGMKIPGVVGIVIIFRDTLGAVGYVEIV